MQEKEMMAQPRTDTAVLVEYMRRCANEDRDLDNKQNKKFLQIADRLTEQEATIRALRSEIVELTAKAMSEEDVIRHLRVELYNASAVAMERKEAIETVEAYIGVLNHRLTTFVKIGVPDSA